MKAALMEKWGEVFLTDLEIPKPGNEEALVKVEYSGVCGTDIHVYHGKHSTATLPLVLGHELSGEICEINSKSERLKKGDKVVVQPYYGCGVCDLCVDGRDNVCSQLKIFGVHENGCFAEYIKVPAGKVYKIGENVDMKLASIAEPLAVAIHDVRRSNLKVGDKAIVLGGGPIGILIAMIARLSGASEVVVSEVNEYRIEFAKAMGFETVNPLDESFMEDVMKYSGGKGYDVVYEATGVEPSALLMTKVCKIGGTIVVIGIPSRAYPVTLVEVVSKELVLKGVRVHSQVNFAAAVDMLGKGVINDQLAKVITHTFKLDDINEAIDFSINDSEHFKVVIQI